MAWTRLVYKINHFLLLFAMGHQLCCSNHATSAAPLGDNNTSVPGNTGNAGGSGSSINTTSPNQTMSTPYTPVTGSVAGNCPSGQANVTVQINPSLGPNNLSRPLAISHNLYSMNLDDQLRGDYVPTPDPTVVAYLKALRPGMLRWPAGYYGQQYTWQTSGSGNYIMTPSLVDAYIAFCQAANVQPFMAVNIETSTIADAVAYLTYTNLTKQYNVTWWQLGNEPDVGGYGNPYTPASYANIYLQYATALLAVDPNIQLTGIELETGADILPVNGSMDWFTPMMQAIGGKINAVAFHYYPMDSSQTDPNSSAVLSVAHLLQESASDWPPAGLSYASQVIPYIRSVNAQYAPNAEVWVDEMAEDPGPLAGLGLSNVMAGAIWAADDLGRFAEVGTNRVFKFIFKGDNPNQAYTLLDANNNPRPEYYTYWLYGQQFGDSMVQAQSSSITQVATHAATLSIDGSLRVFLINKTSSSQTVDLQISGLTPTSVGMFSLMGNSITDTQATLNGQTLTPSNLGQNQLAIAPTPLPACGSSVITLPAASVNLLVFNVL